MSTDLKPSESINELRPTRRPLRRILIITLPIVLFLGALLATQINGTSKESKAAILGKPVPEFALRDPKGKEISSRQLAGKVVVVNFWNSWCIPCKQESGALKSFYDTHRADPDFAMIGVIRDDNAKSAFSAAKRDGYTWIIASDPGSKASLDFGTRGQPETYVISPSGVVVGSQYGPVRVQDLEQMYDAARAQ